MRTKLDHYEQEIEKNISQFRPVSTAQKERIETIVDQANAKKSISLRLKANDLVTVIPWKKTTNYTIT